MQNRIPNHAVRLASRATTALLALAVCVASAAAQAGLNPPENETGIQGKPWLSGFVALLLIGLVGVAAFLKSKRGHQD